MMDSVVAEEIVRTLYRGSNDSGRRIEGGIAPECLFAASSEAVARLYGDRIEHIGVTPSARILVEGTAEFAKVAKRRRGPLLRVLRYGESLASAATAAVASARAAGYDAVEFTSMSDMGVAIMNESAFVRGMEAEVAPEEVRLSGRTKILYHGCASFDAVMEEGLRFERGRTNDFGEGGYLQSCGGIYLTDDLAVAAFYAQNAMQGESWCGGSPCVFAVEIDEALLIADEDKAWDAMRVIIERLHGRKLETDLTVDDAHAQASAFLQCHGDRAVRDIEDKFLLRGADFERADILKAVEGFMLRATSYEWHPSLPQFSAALAAIDSFCGLATNTISRRWLSEHYEQFALSCRTMADISLADGPARIIGHIRIEMDGVGLVVEGVDYEGHFDDEDAMEFEEAFMEKVLETSGCEVTGFDWDDTSEFGL